MPIEIERKFLVDTARLGPLTDGVEISQGYIDTTDFTVVRVRLAGQRAWLTLKGKNAGAARSEFEYAIPPVDARQIMSEMCGDQVIVKTRYHREHDGYMWEIDVFAGANAGLIIAEVELADESDQPRLPDWIAEEVTGDERYYNNKLISHPFFEWK